MLHFLTLPQVNTFNAVSLVESTLSRKMLQPSRLLTFLIHRPSHLFILVELSAKEMYAHLREITKPGGEIVAEFVVRNFVGVIEDISIEASLV